MTGSKKQTGRLSDDIAEVLKANHVEAEDASSMALDEALKLMKMGATPGGEQAQAIGAVFLGLINGQRRIEDKLDKILATLKDAA